MSTVPTSDAELLRQYRAGTQAAFAELVGRHIDWVYSAAIRRVGDQHLAEDVTQAVFMALAKSGRPREETMSPWLFQVLRFTSSKAVRAESRRRRHEMEAGQQRSKETSAKDVQWEEMAPLLDEAVANLGGRDRQAILLRFYERRSFAEVGASLAISEEGARKRVARAIAKLRTYFAGHGLAVPAAALSTAMELNASQTAPSGLAATLGTEVKGNSLFEIWRQQIRRHLWLKAVGLAAAGLAVIVSVIAGTWLMTTSAPPPMNVIPSTAPDAAAKAETVQSPSMPSAEHSPADIAEMKQIIAGVAKAEHQFQNIYVRNFNTTVDKLQPGGTRWLRTPLRFQGSAWYDENPRGKVRIYFSDIIEPWQMSQGSPMSSIEQVLDESWDGIEGHELRVAGQTTRGIMHRLRLATITADRPMWINHFSRWATGVGFSLQYLVKDGDDISPPRPQFSISELLQRILDFGNRAEWSISREKVNGFDAIRFFSPMRGNRSSYISFCFAPSRGYAIVRQEYNVDLRPIRPNGDHRHDESDVTELKELQPGAWFPMQASAVFTNYQTPRSTLRYNFEAEDAAANDPKFDSSVFTAKIPTGWLVSDVRNDSRKDYVLMDDGSHVEIHSGVAMPFMHAGVDTRPDGDTPVAATAGGAAW